MKLESALKHFSPQGANPVSREDEREIAMRDMYEVMDLWGAWAASDNSGVDWQPIAAGFKGLLPHGKKCRLQCNDDDGIMIDGCVARLRKYKPEEYELLIAHFVIGISLRTIAKKRKCSDGTVRKNLQTALGFIDGVLSML
ncbi:antitermination protein [Citrobacter farmeri]|nr:antitermination protein [Citrobacter farmeri]SAZ77052.1 putative antitermination protein Q homolog; DLP12 prophage [Citrobacter amalonaticus]